MLGLQVTLQKLEDYDYELIVINLQLRWEVAGRVVLVTNYVVALVNSFKERKCVSNTKYHCKTTCEELPDGGTRVL